MSRSKVCPHCGDTDIEYDRGLDGWRCRGCGDSCFTPKDVDGEKEANEEETIDEAIVRTSTVISDALTRRLGKQVGVVRATFSGTLDAVHEFSNFKISFHCRLMKSRAITKNR